MHVCNYSLGTIFLTHPQDQAVDVNGSVNFTCEASSSHVIYSWTFNGSTVINDAGHIEGADTSTLMLIGVNVTDGGRYNCQASFGVSGINSDPALLYSKMPLVMIYTTIIIEHECGV